MLTSVFDRWAQLQTLMIYTHSTPQILNAGAMILDFVMHEKFLENASTEEKIAAANAYLAFTWTLPGEFGGTVKCFEALALAMEDVNVQTYQDRLVVAASLRDSGIIVTPYPNGMERVLPKEEPSSGPCCLGVLQKN